MNNIIRLPSGNYRARVTIKGKNYNKTFGSLKAAEDWVKMTKLNKGQNPNTPNTVDISRNLRLSGIIKKHISDEELKAVDEMGGVIFEQYCASLLNALGSFHLSSFSLTPAKADYGADIIIETAYEERICVQCKRSNSKVGVDAVQEVVASKNYYEADKCVVITNNYFSPNACDLAVKNGVLLIDRDRLLKLIEKKNKKIENIIDKSQWDLFVQEIDNIN